MLHTCKSIGCSAPVHAGLDFCPDCKAHSAALAQEAFNFDEAESICATSTHPRVRHFLPGQGMTDIDVYAIHQLFEIHDFSGCIQQASARLLMSGDNSTRKPRSQDIREARDILNRWLELNSPTH